jgi:hypothetical protein
MPSGKQLLICSWFLYLNNPICGHVTSDIIVYCLVDVPVNAKEKKARGFDFPYGHVGS